MKKVIKNTTCADKLLFVLLIAGSIAGIFISRDAVSQSSDVTVEVNGRPAYALPLTVDRTVAVQSTCGETVIEIKNSRVRIREAHCPRQLCVKQGWVARGVIVCLPNKIVVTIGGTDGPRQKLDAVTG